MSARSFVGAREREGKGFQLEFKENIVTIHPSQRRSQLNHGIRCRPSFGLEGTGEFFSFRHSRWEKLAPTVQPQPCGVPQK